MSELEDGATVAEVTRSDGAVAPAIWVGGHESVQLLVEPLALAFHEVDLQRPYKGIVQLVKSIANLSAFYIFQQRPPLDERGLRRLIEKYLLKRQNGDPDLGWEPLSRPALEVELRNIAAYSDFCEREYGFLPLLGRRTVALPAPHANQASFWKLMACNEQDFFGHLAALRTKESKDTQVPGRAIRRAGSNSFVGMSEDFAWRLIEAEKNLTYKAIWLAGFFGGPRVSELLNLWTCDVLPGTCRQHWFPGDTFVDLPLIIIANPWHSKWCGRIGDQRITRQALLLETYGLQPRPRMAETEAGEYRGRAAGFKGTKPTNAQGLMRQVFWAREEAARLFEQVIMQVMHVRSRMPRARLHPFLFVNTDARKPTVQGDMLSLSNVQKAFVRAIRRVDGTPYRWKQSPHGMRHLYKEMIEHLVGGDKAVVQMCMGHWSRSSQDDYGSLDLQALRHALAVIPSRTRQP